MEQKKMKMREMLVCLGLVALLSWVTFHVLFQNHSIETLGETFKRADIRFVIPACLCMFVFLNCEAANIRLLMKTFHKKVPYRRSLCYSFAGFYFSAITPSATGGQPMQIFYMTRDGFGFAHSSFTLLAVAAVYQMTVLVYGSVMTLFNLSYVMAQGALIRWLLVFGILVNGICSGLILLTILNGLLAERVLMRAVRVLHKAKIIKNQKKAVQRIEGLVNEYSRGGAYLRQYPLVVARMFLRSVIQLTSLYLVPWFACMALGMTVEPGTFLAVQAILSLAVTAVPLPGSVGASEGSFISLYRLILGADQTFSVMMLSRGISFYAMLAVSGCVTAVLQFDRRFRRER